MAFSPASAGPTQSEPSRWQLGRPSDLRHASAKSFKHIFGDDVGPYLYRSIQEDFRDLFYASTPGIVNQWVLVLSLALTAFFLARAFLGNTSQNIMTSLRYAGLAFGPPMVFCGHLDQYSPWQFGRLFVGIVVSFLLFLAYLVNLLDRYTEKQKREAKGRDESQREKEK
ncbi:hypothetical protein BBP40_002005 [Aspergillus hancockii]|nr:hypothetical protein BBP40_002005 [Aspergillus hancockii]